MEHILKELRHQRDRLSEAIEALENLGSKVGKRGRKISAAGLAKIRAAQKKRWAAFRALKKKI